MSQHIVALLDEAGEEDYMSKQGELIPEAPPIPPASDNGTGLAARHNTELAPTPMDLLRIATEQGANVDTLAKLLNLQERWEANQARKLFNEAMAKFKKNPPTIEKNKHVKFGNTEYDHATLDHVVEQIGSALSAVGVRHRWETAQNPSISVTCVLEGFGHEERTTLQAPADQSGSKNAIQAIASTVTYLERYTLLAAVGMAAKGQDDDASGLGNDWLNERLDWIQTCRPADLKKTYGDAFKEAARANDQKSLAALLGAYEKRKQELAA